MSHLNITSATATTIKAVAFGTIASLALAFGIAHAQGQRELRASVVTLDPVVVTVKREQLPTVVVTGRRATTDDAGQVASAF
ncbi:hypothetical protein [Mitsuaria sp. GD03876]|uniref:hypothetical protein n=1 Tax=Mitsuaria sp. GD03876 TaxID=2975399 RepID=UPI00244A1770|nr:hypothetical protein [Mitsuaria sp. GD03876]MDH0865492.1 hypothetical protein [Mitsuaria sp. GD03876]